MSDKIKTVITETNGKISYSRVMGSLLIFFYMVIAGTHYFKTGEFLDIPQYLMYTIAALYGVNKVTSFIDNIVQKKLSS